MAAVTVPEMLRALAGIYEQRNAVYGNNYKQFGTILVAMFPDGLDLRTVDDWNRIGIFVQVMAKLTRYTNNYCTGGHVDSLDDTAVYTMMLQELDAEVKQ